MTHQIAAGIIIAYIPYFIAKFGAGLFNEAGELHSAQQNIGALIFIVGIAIGIVIISTAP